MLKASYPSHISFEFLLYFFCISHVFLLIDKATYPYKNTNPSLTCPALDHYNQGAKVIIEDDLLKIRSLNFLPVNNVDELAALGSS